jgi:formylmethanofuran dehydrogenase subunit C
MADKTVIIDGVEVPVLPAKAEEIIINKNTGQTYATIDEFNADVANPNTPTKAEDLQRDLKITVASLQVFGKTK